MKRLFSLLLFTVTFMATAQVANDDCSNATVLQINPNLIQTLQTSGTVAGATASAEANTCAGADDDDVWYQFTATSTAHHIIIKNITGSATDINHVLYEGNDCSTLIQKYCSNPNNSTALGLTIGQTYKIRVYTAISTPGQTTTFDISITTPPAPPINDNCANAITLTVNPLDNNAVSATSTLHQATKTSGLPTGCSPLSSYDAYEDVWFKFVATGAKQKITINAITGSIDSVKYAVYTGTCEALTIVNCTGLYSDIISNLVPGQTYYLRAFSWNGVSQAQSSFTVSLSNLAPANDTCGSATVIIPSISPNCTGGASGDLFYASPTVPVLPGCGIGALGDLWYEFTATNTMHYIWINGIVRDSPNTIVYYVIYSGSCETLTSIKCGSHTDPVYSSFVPGQTYKIRIYQSAQNNNRVSFNICIGTVSGPPANDNCATATPILASTTDQCIQTVSGTVAGATASPETSNCFGTADDDIWYTFVATSTKHMINLSNVAGTTTELYYVVYNDYPCEYPIWGATQKLFCYDEYTNNIYSNYVVGQSYKIKVYSKTPTPYQTTTFNICITTPSAPPPPPANDLCGNAVALAVSPTTNCLQQTTGTTQFATSTIIQNCTSYKDVWYQFTATSNVHMVKCLTPDGEIIPVGLFSGNCTSPTIFKCSGTFFHGLTIGQNYKIRVSTDAPSFTICVTTPTLSVNDECANVISLPVNTGLESTLTAPANFSYSTPSLQPLSCSPYEMVDLWYSFTATSTSHSITLQYADEGGTAPMINVAIYSGECGSLTQLYCGFTNKIFDNLIPGQAYKLRLFNYNISDSYIFPNLSIALLTHPLAPVNDDCSNPTVLTVNPITGCNQPVTGTLTSAHTTVGLTGTSMPNYVDVWYQFTATHTTQNCYITNITNVEISGIEIYEGTCGTLTNKGNSAINNGCVIKGLTPGTTYRIRVIKQLYSNTPIINSFNICITEPYPVPVNDECSTATMLAVNTGLTCEASVSGTLSGSTKSIENPTGLTNYGRDVWYQFTATSTRHHINIGGTSLTHVVYSGSGCGALTPLYTKFNQNSIADNLTIGQTYTIRILDFEYVAPAEANFTICIGSVIAAANDECSNAITLTVNPGKEAVHFVEGSGQLATSSTTGCGTKKDLWYKFTATSTLHYIDFQVTGSINYSLGAVIMANDCASIVCGTNGIALKNMYAPNLTIGQTYYIRLQVDLDIPGELTLFRLAVTTPPGPVNDTCANAITVPVNPGTECIETYNSNFLLATTSQGISGLCTPSNPDLWVKFTATSSNHIIKLLSNSETSNNNAVRYFVYNGNNCILTGDCIQYNYAANLSCIVGETYTIRITHQNLLPQLYNSIPIQLCITTPETCSNPEAFVSGYNEYVFDTTDRVPQLTGITCLENISNAKWFSINITNPGDIEYKIAANTQYDPQGDPIGSEAQHLSYAVWGPFANAEQGCENLSPATILRCQSIYNLNETENKFNINAAQTGQYYIVVVGSIDMAGDSYIKFEQTGGTAASGNVPAPTGDTSQAFGPGQTLADIEMNDDVVWYDNPGEIADVPFNDNDNEPEAPLPLATPLVNGTTYYAAKTIYGIESFIRLAVTVNFVEETPAPTGPAQQDFYNGETIADLEIAGENIKWYNNDNATVTLPLNTLLTDGSSYSASQTVDGLESIQRLTVTVHEIQVSAPTGTTVQYYTQGATLADLNVTGQNIKWYADSAATEALPASTILVDGNTYYASQTISGHESIGRLAVTAILQVVVPAPTGAYEQFYNEGETLADLEVAGENIKWYNDSSTVEALPTTTALMHGNTYYASQTINNTESISRLAVTVFVIPTTPAPTGNENQNYTEGETLATLEVAGESIKWYNDSTSTEVLPITTPLTDATTYYASQTINGTESTERLAVTAHLILGTDSAIFSGLNYYPNPTTGILYIENASNIDTASITNALGQKIITKVINSNSTQVDVSSLSSGIYFVTVTSGNAAKIIKIIKE